MLNRMSSSVSGQVRGIMTDRYGTLWVGTKGDGLIRIPDYQKEIDLKTLSVYSPKGKWALTDYVRGPNFYPVFMLKKRLREMILDRNVRFVIVLLFLSV